MLSRRTSFLLALAMLAGLCLVALVVASIAPSDWNIAGSTITIPDGSTLHETADILAAHGIIRSTTMFDAYATLLGGRGGVKSGSYLFNQPESAIMVAYRMARGITGLVSIKVTIFEGTDSADMARILGRAMPSFNQTAFLAAARPIEGYLFPDTYYFTSADTPASVIKVMSANFNAKMRGIVNQIASSSRSVSDIIKMASIVEKEATSSADRRLVAGVLWKRFDAGMPLQVDPPFYFLLGKTSAQLTVADMATTSPYNLYKHAGLPPTPIDAPGLAAILDTLAPTTSPYWFYLSGSDGVMHYAKDLAGHIMNENKYMN